MNGQAALADVSAAISSALRMGVEIVRFEPAGGGANSATHLKAIDQDGRMFGLKVSARGVPNGTRREYLVWLCAFKLGFAGAKTCFLVQVPGSVPRVGGKEAALIEWVPDGKQLGSLGPPSASRGAKETAFQLGAWMWLCICIGVSDRHPGNWIWSEQGQNKSA